MEIRVDRFLAIATLLAGATSAAVACTENVDTKTDPDSGVAGGGGFDGGAAGAAGAPTAGTAGTGTAGASGTGAAAGSGGEGGGAAGAAGAGGATTDAGQECLGDTVPEGGVGDCSLLPYATALCGSDPDAGVEGLPPVGWRLCDYMVTHGRPQVTSSLIPCLAAIDPGTTDPCSDAHGMAAEDCVNVTFPKACAAPPVTYDAGDGGEVSCADVAASCPAGDGGVGGIDEATCSNAVNAFDAPWRKEIFFCYDASGVLPDGGASPTACEDDFFACVFRY